MRPCIGTIGAFVLPMGKPNSCDFSGKLEFALSVGAVWLSLLNAVSPALAQTWIPTSLPSTHYMQVAVSADGSTMLAGPWDGPIYTSTNSGGTWMELTPPVPPGSVWQAVGRSCWQGLACSADGSVLFGAASNGGLCISTNLGQTWLETLSSDLFHDAACSADGSRLLAVANNSMPVGTTSGIHLSYDGGISWTQANLPILFWMSGGCSADGRTLAIGGAPTIYVSTNWGGNWNSNSAGLPAANYYCVACSADGSRMIAGSNPPGGLFTSLDCGATWTSAGFSNWAFLGVTCSADGKKMAAAAVGGPIYRSTDSGGSWTQTESPLTNWYTMAGSADGNTLIAASQRDYLGLVYTWHSTSVPELKLAASDQNYVLSWILPSRSCVLEEASDLTARDWTTVTNMPVLNYTNLQEEVTIPRTAANRFFRLRVE